MNVCGDAIRTSYFRLYTSDFTQRLGEGYGVLDLVGLAGTG
jgi:hypothetical protein